KSSRAEYDRIIAEWLANGRRLPDEESDRDVNEVIAAFWEHAKGYYRRPGGAMSMELGHYQRCLRELRKLYGTTVANEFGPVQLGIVRDHMVSLGWVRKSINSHLSLVKRVFLWWGANGWGQSTLYSALEYVAGPAAGD